MSTGENINANGSVLSIAMLRFAFHRFPQSTMAFVNPAQWPEIVEMQVLPDYPFKAAQNPEVPFGQVWFIGSGGEILGRIVNSV